MTGTEHIGDLMFRYLRQELSEQEKAELLAWRQELPGNEDFFQQQTDPEYLRKTITAIHAGRDRGLERLLQEHAAREAFLSRRMLGFKVWKVAAFLLALAGLYKLLTTDLGPVPKGHPPLAQRASFIDALGAVKYLEEDGKKGFNDGYRAGREARLRRAIPEFVAPYDLKSAPGRFNTLVTYEQGRYLMLLPDGSRTWQNFNSSVAYPVNFFSDTPEIAVQGEVYVELTPNKSDFSPFVVNTGKLSITAFTGRFNLRAYPKDPVITITAIEGMLQIKSGGSAITLQPREQLVITGDKMELHKNADIGKVLGWKKG